MIKTVLFDLGNVILPYDLSRLAARLSAYSSYSPQEILEKINYEGLADEFETGRMTPEEYYTVVTQSCRLMDLGFSEFVEIYNDIFKEDAHMVTLIKSLKGRYGLGLISNTNPIHVDYLRATFPNLAAFDRLWFSSEAGVRKPNPAIYQMALNHFSSQPSETVFIDDLEPNIASARALGIHGLLYRDLGQLKSELARVGVVH